MKPSMIAATLAVFCTGCMHFANVTHVEDPAGAAEIYESSRVDSRGVVRQTVRERIAHTDSGCDDVLVSRTYFDVHGELERRVIDRTQCGYTVLHFEDHLDRNRARRVRSVQRDSDRDGHFDRSIVLTNRVESLPTLAASSDSLDHAGR